MGIVGTVPDPQRATLVISSPVTWSGLVGIVEGVGGIRLGFFEGIDLSKRLRAPFDAMLDGAPIHITDVAQTKAGPLIPTSNRKGR